MGMTLCLSLPHTWTPGPSALLCPSLGVACPAAIQQKE